MSDAPGERSATVSVLTNGYVRGAAEPGAGTTVWRWHLDEPAASYLVTIAIGHYVPFRERSASGVPLVPPSRPEGAKPSSSGSPKSPLMFAAAWPRRSIPPRPPLR